MFQVAKDKSLGGEGPGFFSISPAWWSRHLAIKDMHAILKETSKQK